MQVLNCSVHKFPSALSTPPHIQTSQLHTHFSDEYSKALSGLYKVQKKKKKKKPAGSKQAQRGLQPPKATFIPVLKSKGNSKESRTPGTRPHNLQRFEAPKIDGC